jgi:hypothetical protein
MVLDDLASGALDEAQAKQLFARFGLPGVREFIVTNEAEAERAAGELGGSVVLKILSAQITHKSDVGGVAVGLNAKTVGARLSAMAAEVQAKAGLRPQRFLVQEMVGGGVEMILGMNRDPLGTAILLGMGGVTAELFKDTAMRMLPLQGGLSRSEALAMAMELRTWPLLDGFRGRPKADVDALVDAVVAFSNMAAQLGEKLLGDSADGDSSGRFARAGAFEDVTNVVKVVLHRPGEIGVARPKTGDAFDLHLVADGFGGPLHGPVHPVAVLDPEGDGRAEGKSVANASHDLGVVRLDLHAAATAIAALATAHVGVDVGLGEREAGGQTLDHHGKALAVAFARGEEAEMHHVESPGSAPLDCRGRR